MTGTARITVHNKETGLSCKGDAWVTHANPYSITCRGQEGKGRLFCNDGRVIAAIYIVETCSSGYGYGHDQNGEDFQFVFGYTEAEADGYFAFQRPEARKERQGGSGTGFFVSENGHIITNHHVIEIGEEYEVRTEDGKILKAKILKSDPANDIAILKVETNSHPLPLCPASNVAKGDEVMALGYPLTYLQGHEQKATFGRINSLSGLHDDFRKFQIDVPIQPGNSGGPLITRQGRVIGITSSSISDSKVMKDTGTVAQNINYAVKSDYVLPLLGSIPGKSNICGKGEKSFEFTELIKMYEKSVVMIIASPKKKVKEK